MCKIAAVVAAGEADGGLRIRRRAAADHDRADGVSGEKTGNARGGSAGRWFAGEEIAGAGIADARGVEKSWRENVSFFEARRPVRGD